MLKKRVQQLFRGVGIFVVQSLEVDQLFTEAVLLESAYRSFWEIISKLWLDRAYMAKVSFTQAKTSNINRNERMRRGSLT